MHTTWNKNLKTDSTNGNYAPTNQYYVFVLLNDMNGPNIEL